MILLDSNSSDGLGENCFGFDLKLHILAEERLYAGESACGRMILVDDLVARFAYGEQFVVGEADYVVVELDEVRGLGSCRGEDCLKVENAWRACSEKSPLISPSLSMPTWPEMKMSLPPFTTTTWV